MLSMPVRPPSWKSAAAMIIIARLTTPAIAIAITTSIFSNRRIRRRSSSLRPDHPPLGQRRVQVDDVRHHRRADDPGGQQDALGAARSPGRTGGRRRRPRPASRRRSRTRTQTRTTPARTAIAASSRRKPRCCRARIAKAPAPAISAAGNSGIPNSRLSPSAAPTTSAMSVDHRDQLGLHPEADRGPPGEGLAAELGQVLAGRDPELRRLGLDQHRDQVGARRPPRAAGSRTARRRRCWWRSCPGRCRRPRR